MSNNPNAIEPLEVCNSIVVPIMLEDYAHKLEKAFHSFFDGCINRESFIAKLHSIHDDAAEDARERLREESEPPEWDR